MDDIFTKTAVNRTAAVVTGRGTHFDPNKQVQTADSAVPLPIRRSDCPLAGVRRGRLTVLGFSADRKGRLVVRCDCGVYTLRRAKAIRNPSNDQDRCEHCRHLAYLKRSEFHRRTGKDVDIRDF